MIQVIVENINPKAKLDSFTIDITHYPFFDFILLSNLSFNFDSKEFNPSTIILLNKVEIESFLELGA